MSRTVSDNGSQFIAEYVQYYNTERRHSGIGYVMPQAKAEGLDEAIFALRHLALVGRSAPRTNVQSRCEPTISSHPVRSLPWRREGRVSRSIANEKAFMYIIRQMPEANCLERL